ncbi:hypothetical protein B0H15DRAFT_357600 [Mycena belliarum]|uniref:Uncharacterized protein n=1 Tax=Mycena belliarum TaxID=1033014 RepID=A0AAD6U376_9AGAR|nr:hypothetical protein B0H15DRAFT_357600 [Mycena belliae]
MYRTAACRLTRSAAVIVFCRTLRCALNLGARHTYYLVVDGGQSESGRSTCRQGGRGEFDLSITASGTLVYGAIELCGLKRGHVGGLISCSLGNCRDIDSAPTSCLLAAAERVDPVGRRLLWST